MLCVCVGNLIEQFFPPDHHYKLDKFSRPIGAIEMQIYIVLVNSKILCLPLINFLLGGRTQKEQAIYLKESETQ